jgi:hypothetical protein
MRDDLYDSTALQDALQFLLTCDIPSNHKAVLIETVTQALRRQDAAAVEQRSHGRELRPWQTQEIEQLQGMLQGKLARSWQHGDELLMHAAAQLRRSPAEVRAQATALGLGEGVDYSLARLRPKEER